MNTTRRNFSAVTFALISSAAIVACDKKDQAVPAAEVASSSQVPATVPVSVEIQPAMLAMYQPLPTVMASDKNPITDAKVSLGKQLYFDARLSKNHDISCNTCHDLAKFGVDNKTVSPGHKKQDGTRNSPTVYNAAGHFAQFWDGRADTVEAQATMPILNPIEMAMPDEAQVLKVVRSIGEYVSAFKTAFPEDADPVTYANLGRAIGAFERKLVTVAPWDRFLQGDKSALSDEQKRGFLAYTEAGCGTCHAGPYLGGQMFQKLGAVKPWPTEKDKGRFEATKNAADSMMFKVPSLRNVEKTGPYFHDGSVSELEKATHVMAEYQLGKQLDDKQVGLIVAFLHALTGQLPLELIKEPILPASGPTTPKPNPN